MFVFFSWCIKYNVAFQDKIKDTCNKIYDMTEAGAKL